MVTTLGSATSTKSGAALVGVRKIWDGGAYNMLTDLCRWRGQWWCAFREGYDHAGGGNGKIRLLSSDDGERLESAVQLEEPGIDLRDPHFAITPDDRLMMLIEGSRYEKRELLSVRTGVRFTSDGKDWTPWKIVLPDGQWLWRATWHQGSYFGVSYTCAFQPLRLLDAALYRSSDGVNWGKVCDLGISGSPTEATVRFNEKGQMLVMIRRDAGDFMGYCGIADPPFTEFKWHPLNLRLGGPEFLQLPDGRWIVGTRDYRKQRDPRSDAWIEVTTMIGQLASPTTIEPLLTLPSGGDNSYPGMVYHDGLLWMSYYSSHEGKANIYLAKVRL